MTKLQLSVAIGNYDCMRPLVDGIVHIDGVDPQYMLMEAKKIHALRSARLRAPVTKPPRSA